MLPEVMIPQPTKTSTKGTGNAQYWPGCLTILGTAPHQHEHILVEVMAVRLAGSVLRLPRPCSCLFLKFG